MSKNVETTSAFLILGMRMKDDTNYIVRPEILVPENALRTMSSGAIIYLGIGTLQICIFVQSNKI